MSTFEIKVTTLDSGFGYVVDVEATVADDVTNIHEHYATEAAVKVRLAAAWDWWAGQVDAE